MIQKASTLHTILVTTILTHVATLFIQKLLKRRDGFCWKKRAPFPLPATFPINARRISKAMQKIQNFVHRTPVMQSNALSKMADRELFFKCEVLQKTGSFKIRGATNAAKAAIKGCPYLVTHSSGNHAQAVALAAKNCNTKAYIVMPRNAPEVKKAAVAAYGGIITLCEPTNSARAAAAQELVQKMHGHFIHPSDDLHVISGQGTVAVEFLQQVPNLDAIIVPVGGGGLISGIAVYAKSFNPNIKIIGAEPALVDDAKRSKDAGKLIASHLSASPDTLADGLKTFLGQYTWPVVRDLVDTIITIDEPAIAQATKLVWSRLKLCIEPSAGVGVALVLSDEFKTKFPPSLYPRVGVILCGGNIDLQKIATKLFSTP